MLILLTGGSGCLGRALISELTAAGHCVIALARTDSIGSGGDCGEVIKMDLSGPIDIARLPPRCDAIVHLAQSREYRRFPSAALDIFRVNTVATVELANYALASGVQHFYFASTGTMYRPSPNPIPETGPIAATSFYAASKLAAEELLAPFAGMMTIAIVRLFYLYGPGQQDRLFTDLAQRLKTGKPIDLQGKDGFRLSPTFSRDAARLSRRAIEERWSGIYNIASSEVVSLRELAVAIGSVLGLPPAFSQSGRSPPEQVLPDLSKMQERAGNFEFAPLAVGLRKSLL